MRRTAAALAVAWAALAALGTAQGIEPGWVGEWHLDLARSRYVPGPPPYSRARYRIEDHGEGLRVVYDMVRPRGGVTHLEWTGALDGRDYAVQGVEDVVTYAYRRLDARTLDVVTKLDGRTTATSRVVLSADGQSITTTTEGRDARGVAVTTVTVYVKRP